MKRIKKCEVCKCSDFCIPIKFEFNYFTCQYDCYWKFEVYMGKVKRAESWYKNTKPYRKDGMTKISYDENGEISSGKYNG